jgi:hypothetical protein
MVLPLVNSISMALIIDPSHRQVKFQSFDICFQLAYNRSEIIDLVIFVLKCTLNVIKLFHQLLILLRQLFNIVSQLLDNRMNRFMLFVQVLSQLTFSLFTLLLV